jgi:hypothetical protein
MSVSIGRDRIVLAGHASVEDAEPLLVALADHPEHGIDVSGLTRAHLAVVQLLHASRRPLLGRPGDPFLRDMVLAGLVEVEAS